MDNVPIGEFIRKNRKARGLSQRELCADVCTREALSLIENGKSLPANQTLHRLLEKLGLPDSYYVVPPEQYELDLQTLRKEARARVITFLNASPENKASMRAEAAQVLQKMESVVRSDDSLTRQQIINEWIFLGTPDGPYSPAEKREKLLEALRLTAPEFDPKHIDDFRYTQEETELIHKIAVTYAEEGNRSAAVELYRQMLEYLQSHSFLLSRYSGQVTLIAFGYARELMIEERYDEAIQIAEIGRQACVKYSCHQYHPQLLAILANCNAHLKNQEKSEELYLQTYYMYKSFGDWNNLEHVRKDALDTLGLTLP